MTFAFALNRQGRSRAALAEIGGALDDLDDLGKARGLAQRGAILQQLGRHDEAIERARETHPDIILMDVQMPNVDGIEAIRRIRAEDPEAKVIVLTTYRNEDYIFPSLQAGARGYLLKDASLEELANAIRAVAAGESLLDPTLMSHSPPAYSLTARELDVLRLMAEHCNNAQIGKRLFVSENTVKTHVSNIFAKLGCSDRAAAVLIAWKAHLI